MKLLLIASALALAGCSDNPDHRDPDLRLNDPAAAIVTKYVEIDGRIYLAQKLPIPIRNGASVYFYFNRWVVVAGPIIDDKPKANAEAGR